MAATIQVNGDARSLEPGQTLRALIESFNLKPEKVAVELNKRLVRSGGYDKELADGDVVEIVTFVGGG